jgi:hypothetical protein
MIELSASDRPAPVADTTGGFADALETCGRASVTTTPQSAHAPGPIPEGGYRWGVLAGGLASLAFVSLVDYVTGYEFLFFVFYFLPVGMYAWFLGSRAGKAMALAAGIVWWAVDRLDGHVYPHPLYRVWNALICLVAFWLVAWATAEIRERLEAQHRLNLALAETLETQKRATEEIRKLQGQMQTVCAWTKRIRVEDKWVSFEEFLRSRLGIEVTHGISEEAAEELRKQLKDST